MIFEVPELVVRAEAKTTGRREFKSPYPTIEDLEVLCQGNADLESLLEAAIKDSILYTETVCKFEQVVARGQISNENGEREEIERIRSSIHDRVIRSINTLSRNLRKHGKDNACLKAVMGNGRLGYYKFAVLVSFEAVRAKGEVAHV